MHRLFTALVVAASLSMAALFLGAEKVASRQESDRQGEPPAQTQTLLTKALTTAEAAKEIIQRQNEAYMLMDKPCPCPYNTKRDGKTKCGDSSAYSKPGGLQPLCYTENVTPDMIDDYLKYNKIPKL
jgi:hypothetical protein